MTRQKKQKQEQVNFRTTPDLKARLQAEADARGLTFNKEINRRLQESISAPTDLDLTRVPGLLAVATAMNSAGQAAAFHSTLAGSPQTPWWNDPYAFDQAVMAANHIFEALRPAGKIATPRLLSGKAGGLDLEMLSANFGIGVANGVISEIGTEVPTSSVAKARAPKLREDLGDELVSRIRSFRKKGLDK